MTTVPPLPFLQPGEPFPPVARAWSRDAPAPGLLAIGAALDVTTLLTAYRATIFPWFSEDEPIMWWSPDPRMVLNVGHLRLHRSLRKVIERFRSNDQCEIRMDSAFDAIIDACARTPRAGQNSTWIVPEMRRAYSALHRSGFAHSVEIWVDDELMAGLYVVAIGRAVFGESMFTHISDGSKIALAALVAFARCHAIELIDCQQNTPHLAFMGAQEMPRDGFARHVEKASIVEPPQWQFEPVYWNALFHCDPNKP